MGKLRAVGVAAVLATGVLLGSVGTASAADATTPPPARTGSAETLASLLELLITGSAGSGSSVSVGVGGGQ